MPLKRGSQDEVVQRLRRQDAVVSLSTSGLPGRSSGIEQRPLRKGRWSSRATARQGSTSATSQVLLSQSPSSTCIWPNKAGSTLSSTRGISPDLEAVFRVSLMKPYGYNCVDQVFDLAKRIRPK